MTTTVAAEVTPLFGDLLDALRRQGFAIGINHYLRLHELLERVGGQCEPQHLKTLLCPIFATSAAQQEQFYATFDQVYGIRFHTERSRDESELPVATDAGLEPKHHPVRPSTIVRRWRRHARWLAGAMPLIAAAIWYAIQSPSVPPPSPVPGNTQPPPAVQQREPTVIATDPIPQPDPTPIVETPSAPREWPYVVLMFVPLVIFLADEMRRYRRRQLVLRRERGDKPPFVWPIHLPRALNPYQHVEALPLSARRLRRREAADGVFRLDVDRTIAATIRALGFPTFRYAHVTKPTEYLVLVERMAPRDHQAALFTDLVAALENEGVPVTRYFFDVDPRVCYHEPGQTGQLVGELRRRYPSHRLLILGCGAGMVDVITGRLHSWVPSLLSWPNRAVLTTTPLTNWSVTEYELAGHFVVLPASVATLGEVQQLFDAQTVASLIPAAPDDEALDPSIWRAAPNDLARALREHLGDDGYQWLCSCALYPELHWDLTLYLGGLLQREDSVFSEETLTRMVRLPWFRTGSIPDEMRVVLLDSLNPELAKAARTAIVGFLERNPPPIQSAAADSYRLNLAVQRLALFAGDRKKRKELLRSLELTPQTKLPRDQVLVRLLENTPRTGVELPLPKRLRRLFFNHGLPGLGWSTAGRLSVAATLTFAMAAFNAATIWRDTGSDDIVEDVTTEQPPDPGSGSPRPVSIAGASNTLFERGDTIRLRIQLPDSVSVPPAVRWTSNDDRVAKILNDREGLFVALNAGMATVSVTHDSVRDSLTITVVEPTLTSIGAPRSVTLRLGSDTVLPVQWLSARGRRLPTPPDVRWRSAAPNVATVDPRTGVIRPVAPGTLSLFVEAAGLTRSLAAVVVDPRTTPAVVTEPTVERANVLIVAPDEARIFVNGREVGVGTWRSDTLPAGEYTISAAVDAPEGCETARVTRAERLAAGGPEHRVTLSPRTCGQVVITGDAGGSYQLLHTEDQTVLRSGTLPLGTPLVVPAGGYVLRASRTNCDAFRGDVNVTSRQVVRLTVAPCPEVAPDVDGFTRDVVQPAVNRVISALSAADTLFLAGLIQTGTAQESRQKADLIELLRRREFRLSARAAGAPSRPRVSASDGEGEVRIQLNWRNAFGAARRETIGLRLSFARAQNAWQLNAARFVGSAVLR